MARSSLLEGRFRAGTLLAGRYELRSVLGLGGMSEVYLATDRLLRRPVAVKLLGESLARDAGFVARFHREARAAASLSHPGIVAVHDIGWHRGMPFIVMEYVPGRSIAEVLESEGALTTSRAVEIGEAIAGALACAHLSGIVHRDVKPANVMISPAGDIKVLDFGIARVVDWTPLTPTPGTHGTPEYLSPEQASGLGVDGRSDVYAAGVCLYEMLTGSPPFSGSSHLAVALSHVRDRPSPPSRKNPAIAPRIDAIVMRCLEKDPDDRYQSAEDLREELARFRGGRPALTPPLSLPARAGWQPRRLQRLDGARRAVRPALRWVGLAVLLVMAAIAGAGLLFVVSSERTPAAPRATSPPSPPVLLAPTALQGAAECDGFMSSMVTLRWSPSTSTVTDGYQIYRGTSRAGPYQSLGVVLGPSSTEYADRDLDTGTTYHYLVRATGDGRTSVGSAHDQVTTPFFCVL